MWACTQEGFDLFFFIKPYVREIRKNHVQVCESYPLCVSRDKKLPKRRKFSDNVTQRAAVAHATAHFVFN